MSNGVGARFGCYLDQTLCNQWSSDRGAKKIGSLIDRVRPEHRKNEVPDKLFPEILYEDLLYTHHFRFPTRRLQFFTLPQVSREGHHLAAILCLKPLQNDRGIETARIGEHHFFRGGF